MKKIFSATLVASVIALVPAGAALADPPNTLVNVPGHQHFIQTAKGLQVPIGPDVCEDPDLQQAFNQFHFNVHSSGLRGKPIETLGPQNGAPGLHNDHGAELTVGRCD